MLQFEVARYPPLTRLCCLARSAEIKHHRA